MEKVLTELFIVCVYDLSKKAFPIPDAAIGLAGFRIIAALPVHLAGFLKL